MQAATTLRVIYLPELDPWDTHACYQGIADAMLPDAPPVLILTSPDQPYISIGAHQNPILELDMQQIEKLALPIVRRPLGGGTVLLDANQLFFQFIIPRQQAPKTVETLFPWLIKPVVKCYQAIGINAEYKAPNDIWVNQQKIGGTGAASIGDTTVMAGSFLFKFDFNTMAKIIRAPSDRYRQAFKSALRKHITTLHKLLPSIPPHSEMIEVFCQQITKYPGWQPISSEITTREHQAIAEARSELTDDEWLFDGGKKAVPNGIKLASGIYLTEAGHTLHDDPVTITLMTSQNKLVQLHVESKQQNRYDNEVLQQLVGMELSDVQTLHEKLLNLGYPFQEELAAAILSQHYSE